VCIHLDAIVYCSSCRHPHTCQDTPSTGLFCIAEVELWCFSSAQKHILEELLHAQAGWRVQTEKTETFVAAQQVLRKRKMTAILHAWFANAAGRRTKRQALARAARFWVKQQLGKAWNGW
jgi:hypothetical protein